MTAPSTWEQVAAAGTDPEWLATVVTALDTDESGTRRAVADALDRGADPAAAVRAAIQPSLPVGSAHEHARRWAAAGVRVGVLGDPWVPARLVPLPDPPVLLAVRGTWPPPPGPAVAIVGSRRATEYGRGVAAWLAEAAGAAGVRVVSGGAVGIDAAAHTAAVDSSGGTTVVLGCGHDVPYPRPHARAGGLFDQIVGAGGAVVSELLPDTPPQRPRVRSRNRIVAGLADVVVVAEGGDRSGSLVTATNALDRGVPVMAVPGDVRAPGSAAPHRLLAEGAAPCTRPADLLEALGLAARTGDSRPDVTTDLSVLPATIRKVLVAAWPRPLSLDLLAHRSGTATGALLAALTRARVAGEVAQSARGVVLRRAP